MVLLFDDEYDSLMFDMERTRTRPDATYIGFGDPMRPDWGGPTASAFDSGPRRMSGPSSAPVFEEHPDFFNPSWGGGGFARPDPSFDFPTLPGWKPATPEYLGFEGWSPADYIGFDEPPAPGWSGDRFRLGLQDMDALQMSVWEQQARNYRDTWELEGRPNWEFEQEQAERVNRETWELEGRPDEAEAIRNWLRQREGPDTLRMGRRLEEMSLEDLQKSFQEESTYQDKPIWAEPEVAAFLSGEKTLGALGIDTSGLPDKWYFPLRQAVDMAAAPATWATAGLGSGVPIIGSAFGGGFAGRLAGEAALGTVGTVAGQETAKGLQRYGQTDMPFSGVAANPWVQAGAGLGAGVLAAGAGLGAVKNADSIVRGRDVFNEGLARVQGYPEPVFGGAIINASEGAAAAIPSPASAIRTPDDLLNLPDLAPQPLGMADRAANVLKRTLGIGTEEDAIATPAMRSRAELKPVVESQANRFASEAEVVVTRHFDLDRQGRVLNLGPVPEGLPPRPTVQDLAARLPAYRVALDDAQVAALEQLREMTAPYRAMLERVGVEFGSRADVMEGGFYLPRGRADLEGADVPVKVGSGRGGVGGRRGFEKSAVFESMGQGIDAGYRYAPLRETFRSYAKDAGTRIVDQHTANYLKNVVDPETGLPLASSPHARLLEQNPQIASKVEGIRRRIDSMRGTIARLSERQQAIVDEFRNSPAPDVDALRDALDARAVVMRGANKGADIAEMRRQLLELRRDLVDVAPEWRKALERARQTPRAQSGIGFAQLSGYSFPDEVANAANKYLRAEGPAAGRGAVPVRVTEAFNSLLRGMRATADVSFMGIQGLLGLGRDPVGFANATKVALKAMVDQKASGKFMLDFDARAAKTGRLTSAEWAKSGLHIGGTESEFTLGQGLAGKLGSAVRNAPVAKQSNRMFGYFGDTFRLELADTALQAAKASGKTMDDATFREAAMAANRLTGYSPRRFGGDVGGLAMFAPRFFQSQLDVLGKALVDRGVQGHEARQALVRMIGLGAAIVYVANELSPEGLSPTEYGKPFRGEGRFGNWREGMNSNFMRVRTGGRDWSPFGTWDSLVRGIVATGGGDLTYVPRSKASPAVGMAWDIFSGKDFTGKATRDGNIPRVDYLLRSLLPFSSSAVGEVWADGVDGLSDLGAKAATTVGVLAGAKSSQLSEWEARDQAISKDPDLAQYRKPGSDPSKPLIYENLSPRGAQLAREKYGTPESPNDTLQANREEKAEIEKWRVDQEKTASAIYTAGDANGNGKGDGVALREAVGDINEEVAARKLQVDESFKAFTETGVLPTDPYDRAMTQYYALYDLPGMRKPGGDIDYERFEEEESKLRASWTNEQREYVDTQRTETAHEPAVAAMYAARDAIDASGYFALKDEAWEAYKKSKGKAAEGIGGYWEWRDESVREEYDKLIAGGKDPLTARHEAERVVAGYKTISVFNEFFRNEFRHDWVEENEALARQAIHYGYLDPDKGEREWLEAQWKKQKAGKP